MLNYSDHATRPDIVITHPNTSAPSSSSDWRWHLVASSIKVKAKASQDPFDSSCECKIGDMHDRTIVQLAKNGRNLLMGNMSCFVFVVGMYGDRGHSARIYDSNVDNTLTLYQLRRASRRPPDYT